MRLWGLCSRCAGELLVPPKTVWRTIFWFCHILFEINAKHSTMTACHHKIFTENHCLSFFWKPNTFLFEKNSQSLRRRTGYTWAHFGPLHLIRIWFERKLLNHRSESFFPTERFASYNCISFETIGFLVANPFLLERSLWWRWWTFVYWSIHFYFVLVCAFFAISEEWGNRSNERGHFTGISTSNHEPVHRRFTTESLQEKDAEQYYSHPRPIYCKVLKWKFIGCATYSIKRFWS